MGGCKVDPKIAFVKPLSGVLYTVEKFWLQGGLDRRSLARLARVGRDPSTEWSIIGQTGEARLGFGMIVSYVSALRSGRRLGKVAMGGLETGGHGHVRHRWLLLDVPILSFPWSKYLGKLIQGDFPGSAALDSPTKILPHVRLHQRSWACNDAFSILLIFLPSRTVYEVHKHAMAAC